MITALVLCWACLAIGGGLGFLFGYRGGCADTLAEIEGEPVLWLDKSAAMRADHEAMMAGSGR